MRIKVIILVAIGLLLTGCKGLKQTVEVPVYIHDTMYQSKEVHDSTYIDRWHTEYQKGDTIFVTNEVTKFRYVIKTDTAYKYIEVPVTVTTTEIKEVKKPLSWWEKGFIGVGVMLLLALAGMVIIKLKK